MIGEPFNGELTRGESIQRREETVRNLTVVACSLLFRRASPGPQPSLERKPATPEA